MDQIQPIRERLNHWTDFHLLPLLENMSPLPRSAFPPNLTSRQQDLCEPLLQLAGLIGGPWPVRAFHAFSVIFDLQALFEFRTNLQLLLDVRDCFADHANPKYLSSANLVDWTHSLPPRRWDADGPLNAQKVARLLSVFDIRPRLLRIKKGKGKAKDKDKDNPARGYQLKDIEEACQKRLVSAAQPSEIANKACPRGEPASRRDAGCSTVSPVGAFSSDDPMTQACPRGELAQPKEPDDLIAGLAASSQKLEAQKHEIKNLKSFVTCSPECELETRRLRSSQNAVNEGGSASLPPHWTSRGPKPRTSPGSPPRAGVARGGVEGLDERSQLRREWRESAGQRGDQNYNPTKLSLEEIRKRKEDLIRELAPYFEQPVAESQPDNTNHEPEISNQKSEITNENAVCNTVAHVATPVPATTNNRKSEIQNLKSQGCQKLAAPPSHDPITAVGATRKPDAPMEWSVLRERLRSLRDQLRLRGHLNMSYMAESYTPAALQARLDWVDANPRWVDFKRGMSADDFVSTFARIRLNSPW